jgi:hypothetical protein
MQANVEGGADGFARNRNLKFSGGADFHASVEPEIDPRSTDIFGLTYSCVPLSHDFHGEMYWKSPAGTNIGHVCSRTKTK